MKGNGRTERAWRTLVEDALESVFGSVIAQWPQLWHSLLNHCRRWPLPSRWSAADWAREIEDIAILAALEARKDFDPQQGIAWPAFVKWRIRQALLIRYRKEYGFGQHCSTELPVELLPNVGESVTEAQRCALAAAREKLAAKDQELLYLLYEAAETEAAVAAKQGMSQQAISKRKCRLIGKLQQEMKKSS